MQLNCYQIDGFYDEAFDAKCKGRPEARLLLETIESGARALGTWDD
jgi:hypothetical protein